MNYAGINKVERSVDARKSGFTIVELLIVIVVIGILAAISIVAYNGIQNRANDMVVKQDLASLAKRYEMFKVDNYSYPTSASDLSALNFKASKGAYYTNITGTNHSYNLVPCVRSSGEEYSVAAISASGKKYFITNVAYVQGYTGSNTWSTFSTMWSPTLASGSTVISGGAGFAINVWRAWTG